jgi:chromosome segregation ATPase
MYLPSQNEIVEGLSSNVADREHNIVKGSQDFQMTHELNKNHNDISEVADGHSIQQNERAAQEEIMKNNEAWAQELRKADERCEAYRANSDEQEKRKKEVEDRYEYLEKQVHAREDEIQRLNTLYQGGQNLDKLNMRYVHESNEKELSKLSNQIDFLNRDNQKLQQQNDFLRGDGKAVDRINQMTKQLDDLAFENRTLKEDLKECTILLKNHQMHEMESKKKLMESEEVESARIQEYETKIDEIKNENDKIQAEYERAAALRSAYNADREAFVQKIHLQEREIENCQIMQKQAEEKVKLIAQDINQHKNEINFWTGKCSTLQRDLDHSERYNTKFKEQNIMIDSEISSMKVQMEFKDKETALLRKQINGLKEDNERKDKQYKMIEREAFAEKPT